MNSENKLKKTRLLINMSTITVGGGVQSAITFLEYLIKKKDSINDFEIGLILTNSLKHKINKKKLPFKVFMSNNSPSHPIMGFTTRKKLLKIETEFCPDIIFSFGFPSYVKFINPEIGRYTNPFEICDVSLALSQLNFLQKLKRKFLTFYRLYYAKNASYFITQTKLAKKGIIEKFEINEDKVFISRNTVNFRFNEKFRTLNKKDFHQEENKRIFCLSAAHKHKNLEIIPYVAFLLSRETNLNFKFYLTLPENCQIMRSINEKSKKLGVISHIQNLGELSLDSVKIEYQKAHCLFLPTLIEIFSATYIEAMSMRVPILTTNLEFAKNICGKAALYFEPLSAKDATEKIIKILTNKALRKNLIIEGANQISKFPTQNEKFTQLLSFIKECAYDA